MRAPSKHFGWQPKPSTYGFRFLPPPKESTRLWIGCVETDLVLHVRRCTRPRFVYASSRPRLIS